MMRQSWTLGVWLTIAVCVASSREVNSDFLGHLLGRGHSRRPAAVFSPSKGEAYGRPQHSRKQSVAATAAAEAKAYASRDGVVLWTLANYSWLDFALNWVEMVRKAGIRDFFVATLDDKLAKELRYMGTPCVMLHTQLGGGDLDWGSDAFKQRGIEKIQFIIAMLELGLQPVFSDLDVAWLRDPRPFLASFPDPNILISSDSCDAQTATTLDNCGKIVGTSHEVKSDGKYVGVMNVGIHLIRPSALHFAKAWLEQMRATGEMEQLCWNRAFVHNLTLPGSDPDMYCRSMAGTITAGILPAAAFMNGHTAFAQHLATTMSLQPFAVHASWVAGAEAKRFHFQEEGMWLVDDDDRFNAPSLRLLWLDLDVPEDLLSKSGPPGNLGGDLELKDVEGHFYLVRHQMMQVRAAAEMAAMLNRTLIMPQLYCGMENLWKSHKGRFWYGVKDYPLPYPCSMTQLFEVLRWKEQAKEQKVLPPYVESSFIDNPKLKLEHQDKLSLSACVHQQGGSTAGCCNSSAGPLCKTSQHTWHMSPGLAKSQFKEMMKGAEGVKLVQVRNVLQYWPQPTREQYDDFDLAFDGVRRDWCCVRDDKRVFIDLAVKNDT